MADLIDRQVAIHEIHKQVWLAETAKTFLTEALNELPSSQPERKKGRWRPVQIGKWHGFECTGCKVTREVPCSNNGVPQWKYCPDCGAKMEVGHDNA